MVQMLTGLTFGRITLPVYLEGKTLPNRVGKCYTAFYNVGMGKLRRIDGQSPLKFAGV